MTMFFRFRILNCLTNSRVQRSLFFMPVALLLVLTGNSTSAATQVKDSLATVFPGTTAVFLEVEHPDQLIDKIENHAVTKSVNQLPAVKKAFKSPEALLALVAVKLIESELGQPLLESIKENCSQGLALGVDPATDGVAIVFRSQEEAKLRRLAGVILQAVSRQASAGGDGSLYEKKNYRDAVAAQFDKLLVARYKDWFVISNKNELAKQIVDNLHDGTEDSLALQPWFLDAYTVQDPQDATLVVDLESLKKAGVARELFKGTTDNPAAELILGGVFDALKHAPTTTLTLNLDSNLQLNATVPFQETWASKSRRFFYGEDLSGNVPAAFVPKNMVASLTTYRDVADWWLSKEDLFEEGVIAELAQVDSQLSTIFSGMDFGEDVLGSLQPGLQVVVTENTFEEKYNPNVKLPAFALIGKLKDPANIQRKLKIAFQSVIGFANINLGMQGQPQLDLETETIGEAKLSSAQYYYESETPDGLLLFNFSPAVAFNKEFVIFASTRSLAVELAELVGNPSEMHGANSNTRLTLDAIVLNRILRSNIESLVTQNMLTEGSSKEDAQQAIETLLSVVDLFEGMEFDYRIEPDEMTLQWNLNAK